MKIYFMDVREMNFRYSGSVCSDLDLIKKFLDEILKKLNPIIDNGDIIFDIKLILNVCEDGFKKDKGMYTMTVFDIADKVKDKISNDERQATLNSLKFLNDWIETLETSKEHMSNELNCINQYQNTDIKEEEH